MAEILVEQLVFSKDELMARLDQTRETLASQGLDGILFFRQESMYYLTAYETDSFVLFPALFLGVNGQLTLVTRSADRVQAVYTPIIEDVRIWVDSGSQNPATDVKNMLDSHGMRGKQLGVEYDAYGLSAKRGKMLDKALAGFCQLADASDLVRLQRIRKSPAELEYTQEDGRICDAMRDEAIRLSVPGTFEGAWL